MTTNKKLSFSAKNPIWTVTIIEVLVLLAMTAAGAYATIKELSYTAPVLIAFIPISLAIIIYLTWKKKWQSIGFRSLRSINKSNWYFYLPLIAILILLSTKGIKSVTGTEVMYSVFLTLLVGFVEETIYRGLIFRTLLKKSITAAVVTSSILFSITHMLNMLSGQNAADTIFQLIYSLLIGLALVLLVVKMDNIIPAILFHFIHNLLQDQFIGNPSTTMHNNIIICIVVLLCVWLIIDLKRNNQLRKFNKNNLNA